MPRDLLTHPAHRPEDLGVPLPDCEHAVSVALPTWRDIIDYEEEHPRIVAALQAGYPRFFLHPRIIELIAEATRRAALPTGWTCLVFPSRAAAERCAAWVTTHIPDAPHRLTPFGHGHAWILGFPEPLRRKAREYWRYCGEAVSSRQALRLLAGTADHAPLHRTGAAARETIRQRLAALHGVNPADVYLHPSGMAAFSTLHRAVCALHPQRPTVQLDFPYVDALKVQQEFGSAIFHPVADPAALRHVAQRAAQQTIAGVFCEMPSNPLLRCVDVQSIAPALRTAAIPLLIDDTIAGVTNIHALRYADAVTTSLTKAFSGIGDVLAGSTALHPQSPHYAHFTTFLEKARENSPELWAEDAIALELNSRDYPERMARMSATAATLADFLTTHPAVETVYYPALEGPFQSVARPDAGRGSLLSFVLKDPTAAPLFYDRLPISKGPSLGTNFTLCCPFTMLAHYHELDWAATCGVRADLLRLSAGLEAPDTLIHRLSTALS